MVRIASVSELCAPYRRQVPIFDQLCNSVTPELHGLIDAVESAIDFSSHIRTRPVIKFGLDEKLDASEANFLEKIAVFIIRLSFLREIAKTGYRKTFDCCCKFCVDTTTSLLY